MVTCVGDSNLVFGHGKEVATFDAAITKEVFLKKIPLLFDGRKQFYALSALLMSSSYIYNSAG